MEQTRRDMDKNERNPAKEIDKFFKEMGLEEEIKKISDLFTDNFMIKGEETEDLMEAVMW